jgi:hypothetical protein
MEEFDFTNINNDIIIFVQNHWDKEKKPVRLSEVGTLVYRGGITKEVLQNFKLADHVRTQLSEKIKLVPDILDKKTLYALPLSAPDSANINDFVQRAEKDQITFSRRNYDPKFWEAFTNSKESEKYRYIETGDRISWTDTAEKKIVVKSGQYLIDDEFIFYKNAESPKAKFQIVEGNINRWAEKNDINLKEFFSVENVPIQKFHRSLLEDIFDILTIEELNCITIPMNIAKKLHNARK